MTSKWSMPGVNTSTLANAPHNTNILDMTGTNSVIVADLFHGYLRDTYTTGILSVSWFNRLLVNDSGVTVIGWNDNAILDGGGINSILWGERQFFDSVGGISGNYDQRVLYFNGSGVINWGLQWLVDDIDTTISLDWTNRVCYDISNVISLDYQNRTLKDTSGNIVLDWSQLKFYNFSNVISGDWHNLFLYNAAGHVTVDWGNSVIADGLGITAFDGVSRALASSNSAQQFLWDTTGVYIIKVLKSYNGINTVGNGAPAIYATVGLTTQAAAITATTIYATPNSTGGNGLYRLSFVASVTRAANISSTLGGTNGFQVTYTDQNDSVVKTSNPSTPDISAGNTTATTISGSLIVNAKQGTNIQYAFGYTSSGTTTMQYDLAIRLEAI